MATLELKQVNKMFTSVHGAVNHVLKDISFSAHEGEFFSIVGPSGCGKSTLLRLISGLIPVTTGEIALDGTLVKGTDPNRGMVFQNATLFPWLTVYENINFPLRLKKEKNAAKVDHLIQMIGLQQYANYYPAQLSGGMAQRVSLARTMINEPEVFLLDEPLGALDAFTRMAMQEELLEMWQTNNHLMMMVTHDVDEAIYMSSKVIIMDAHPGRIKEVLPIEMPYPRQRTSEDFFKYRSYIMDQLDFDQQADEDTTIVEKGQKDEENL